jgi:hypothetical protein
MEILRGKSGLVLQLAAMTGNLYSQNTREVKQCIISMLQSRGLRNKYYLQHSKVDRVNTYEHYEGFLW